MAADPRIAKIRALAERGATEGERAAARAALERLEAAGIAEERPRPGVRIVLSSRGTGTVSTAQAFEDIIQNLWDDYTRANKEFTRHNGRVHYDRGDA